MKDNWKLVLITLLLACFVFSHTVNAQKSYTLQEAIQTAKANNPGLKTDRFNIDIAQTDIITAKLFSNPFLENEQYYLPNPKNFVPGTDLFSSQNIQMLVKHMQPIPIAGQRKNKIKLSQANVNVELYKYYELERNIFSEVANKWLDVWMAQKQLEIIQKAKNNVDSLVLINQNRFKNQVITQTDLHRTELLSKQLNIQLKAASLNVKNKLSELKFLLGVEGDIEINQSDDFLYLAVQEIDSLIQFSLKNRSDIQLTNLLIEANNINIKLQKSLAVPGPQVGFVLSPQNGITYFGPSFSLYVPLFDRNQGEIKKSYLQKQQAEAQLLTLKLQMQTEVSVAYANYRLQQQSLENFNVLLQQSQIILDNVKYAYMKGGTSIIDFLEAQRSWIETQQQFYEAMYAYKQSYIQLLYATGLINQLAL